MADSDSRAGARYATDAVLRFVDSLHAPHDPALAAAFAAPERNGMPAIQVGPSEGKLVELLVGIRGATRALEIGTLAGYSAIRIARGLAPGGTLITVEKEPRHAEVARARIAEAGFADRVEVRVGDAVEVLASLEDEAPFDVVFLDADKGRYDVYGRWAYDRLAPGGLLLADNAYFFGRLTDADDPDAAAMRRFHTEAAARLSTVCIPTPDGLVLGWNHTR